jgi:hypothetical protein
VCVCVCVCVLNLGMTHWYAEETYSGHQLSLIYCSRYPELAELLKQPNTLLLYPGPDAVDLSQFAYQDPPCCSPHCICVGRNQPSTCRLEQNIAEGHGIFMGVDGSCGCGTCLGKQKEQNAWGSGIERYRQCECGFAQCELKTCLPCDHQRTRDSKYQEADSYDSEGGSSLHCANGQNTEILNSSWKPGQHADVLCEVPAQVYTGNKQQGYNLVILDGTWAQAKGLYCQNEMIRWPRKVG